MTKDKLQTIISILLGTFLALFLLMAIMGIVEFNTDKLLGYNEKKCFDKRGNEIVGQKCLAEVWGCGAIQNLINTCKNNYPIDKELP